MGRGVIGAEVAEDLSPRMPPKHSSLRIILERISVQTMNSEGERGQSNPDPSAPVEPMERMASCKSIPCL